MRDVDLSAFKPQPDSTYIAALMASSKGDAVGLVVVRESLGRVACQGRDFDPGDGYDGDILRAADGKPFAAARVQYFQADNLEAPVLETVCDAQGRHSVQLEPGAWAYRYVLHGGLSSLPPGRMEWNTVDVARGRVVKWEEWDENDASQASEREVGFVTEEWIADWHKDDRDGKWSWNDVENTVVAVFEKISRAKGELRQVVTSVFPKQEMLTSLTTRGLWAVDLNWKELQWLAGYRNFIAMGNSDMASVIDHDRADSQMRLLAVIKPDSKRVESTPGVSRYLADARVMAFTVAGKLATLEGEGTVVASVLGDSMLEDYFGGVIPKSAAESKADIMGRIMKRFG